MPIGSIKSLCVYCGSSSRGAPSHLQAAEALGAQLGARGIKLVYGGGMIGLMGIVADATLQAGGQVIGVIPKHLDDLEVGHRGVTQLIVSKSMHDRKETMFQLADAFAILPGGYGTLDEFFEILTWRQLALHDKPVILVDVDNYWKPLTGLLDHIIAEHYAKPETRRLYEVAEGIDGLFEALEKAPPPRVAPKDKLI